MSHIPRRTSEFQTSSVRKSVNPRTSRLTQNNGSSALRLPRFSATPMKTPSRTPNRSNSKDRISAIPMTAEKEKAPVDDKVFIHSKTMQVLDELTRIDGFTELVNKGLKSMTHKQFISILQHFLEPIVGSLKFDSNNYQDYVYNFVQTMDYPYTINKSSLKTPSAPHCQNSIIILLAWLSEFTLKETESDPLIEYGATEDYNNPEISTQFMEKTAQGFVLWNNQQEAESDDIMQAITDIYVQKSTDNIDDLDADITKLKKEVEKLRKEIKPSDYEETHKAKQEQSKQLSVRTDDLTKAVEDLSYQVTVLTNTKKAKLNEMNNVQQEYETLHKKILSQKMTQEDKNKLLSEISQAKSVLSSKKQTVMELKELNSESEIKLSNLIQKKYSLIDRLNNALYMITSKLESAKIHTDFDPAPFEIKTTKMNDPLALEAEVDKMQSGLMKLKQKYDKAIVSYTKQSNMYHAKLPTIMSKKQSLKEELASLKSVVEELSLEEERLSKDLAQRNMEKQELIASLDAEIKEAEEEIKKFKSNIAKFKEINAKHIEKKAEFKTKSTEMIKNLYEKRRREVSEKRQRLEDIKSVIEDFERRQRPFPQEVQNTIDKTLAKRGTQEG